MLIADPQRPRFDQRGGTSGASGFLVALFMLIAGIVAIAARNSRGGSLCCTLLYALAGLLT